MKTFETPYDAKLDREMLRSQIFSAIWTAFQQKRADGVTLSSLAEAIGKDKAYVSRLLNSHPNCKLSTLSDLAYALDIKPHVEFTDRKTGAKYTSSGVSHPEAQRNDRTRTHSYDMDMEFQFTAGVR